MTHENAYSRFIEHLREWYMGLPDAEMLLPLLKSRFTLEEAEFLADFPFLPQPLEDLAGRYQRPVAELKTHLEALAEKGLIFERETGKTVRYSLNDSMFSLYRSPFWSGKADESQNNDTI